MKPYTKKVIDMHHYINNTRRRKQNKNPKRLGIRKGTKTAKRMADKRDMMKET